MGKATLRTRLNSAKEKTIVFIHFLDSLDLNPQDLPQDDFRALSEAVAFLQKYSELLNGSKNVSPKQLSETENCMDRLEGISNKAKEHIINYILENFSTPNNEQFKNYHAYAKAEKVWHDYNKFIQKHKFEQLSLERMQALIDRTSRPDLLFSVFLSFLDKGLTDEGFHTLQDALSILSGLMMHTPRSEFSSKTPYQKVQEERGKQFEKFKEEKSEISFSDYDFEGLFNKLKSGDANERKMGDKLLEQLWNNYVNEKHGRIKTEDKKHHKNIIALWEQVKQRFYRARSAQEKILALKPFTRLWCTFVPSQFYDELKELILKGIFNENGTVRYRVVRIIDSVAFELLERAPECFNDLHETVKAKREDYLRQNKLSRFKRAYSENIKDGVLRSLTQSKEFLDDSAWRHEAFRHLRLPSTLNER